MNTRHRVNTPKRRRQNRQKLHAVIALALLMPSFAHTQNTHVVRAPEDLLERIEFEQKLGARLPLQLPFLTSQGAGVQLKELLRGRPTLLVAGYYHCASLCGVSRAGIAQAVARSGLQPGRDFNVVLFSIDPRDNAATALATQRRDAQTFPGARVSDWFYLTGAQSSSAALAAALGFRYVFDAHSGQFNHPAGIVLLTPRGDIAQYLFGVQFAPQTLRLALVAASNGGIGNAADRLLLLCSDYDAATGRYSALVERLLAVFSISGALLLGAGIVLLRLRERRRIEQVRP